MPSYILLLAVAPLIVRFLAVMVNDAAFDVAEPHEFVKTARYWLPDAATVGLMRVSVEVVTPVLPKPEPEFTCQSTVGAGDPLAAAAKAALAP